jgi:hypothetical protein
MAISKSSEMISFSSPSSRDFNGTRALTLYIPTNTVGAVGVLLCCSCEEAGPRLVLKH